MKRLALPLVAALATTPKVEGKNVKGALLAGDVDPAQQKYATCATARKVMNRMLSLRIEEPRSAEGFRCTPTVQRTNPTRSATAASSEAPTRRPS